MTEDTDYSDIVDQTVDDAKDSIREMENPDYEALLEAETQGENRKTLRTWLENRLEEQEREAGKEEAREEMFLSSLAPSTALVGGLVVGLVVGLAAGAFGPVGGSGAQASTADVRQSMNDLFSAAGSTPESVEVTRSSGMFLVNVTSSQGNQTASQQFYVSPDGELLIRTRGPFGRPMVQPIDQLIQQLEQQPSNATGSQDSSSSTTG
ncbi:MAG: hypothetical protein ABEJ64_01020 [Candidatus Nanohaloarchaea archaeon]